MDNKNKMPLISILIPTYNQTKYLKFALESAINQTYKNIEIVICDDSTTDDVKNMLKPYIEKNSSIKYYNNGGPLGKKGALNIEKCFELSNGEYINYLMHDDLFLPEKISSMLNYMLSYDNIGLVTSYRKLINENNEYLQDLNVTQRLISNTAILSGEELGKFTLTNVVNVIGEFTTAFFKKSDISGKILEYYGEDMRCLGDVALWLKLLRNKDAIYISEPLSQFRIHSEQNTFDKTLEAYGALDWYYLIELSYRNKVYIKDEKQYYKALRKWMRTQSKCIENFLNYDYKEEEIKLLKINLEKYYFQVENKLKII
jgi:glycosyltransferase involved in cell wall biosynthesis